MPHSPRSDCLPAHGRPTLVARAAVIAALLAPGCYTPSEQLRNADRAAYDILVKRRAELGEGGAFTIEPATDSLRQRLLAGEAPAQLGLVATLQVAAENSRDFQRRKEDLYLSALDLTLERFAFQSQRTGQLDALVNGSGAEATSASAGAGASLRRLLGAGALWVGDIGLSLARSLTSSDSFRLQTDLGLSVTQPLLRGFGRRIVMEPLTQAERNVVYQVRTFERFRRTFAVDATSRYLRIIQQVLQLRNEEENVENLETVRERNEALSAAGRLSEVQVDQAQQDELRSRSRVIDQQQRLQSALDSFKLFLGLPIQTPLELDTAEVERLDSGGSLEIDEERAVRFALEQRLDYLTALDQVADAERKIPIAANRLLAAVDLHSSVNASSEAGKPLEFDQDGLEWDIGLDVKLPIDLISQRNAYRETLITLERAKRAEVELADSIRVALRDELRQARTQLETLRIQENAVALAERRIESTDLNRQAGRAETRDFLEAREALRQARNALIAARVDYHLARLSLWRDMELLRVDEEGVRPDAQLLAPADPPHVSPNDGAQDGAPIPTPLEPQR